MKTAFTQNGGYMQKLKILIADDEYFAREVIKTYLTNHESVELTEASSGKETVNKIIETKPDLLFLDVQMPELNGIEVLNTINPSYRPAIIFTTAFQEYAVKAFELNATDYLLKPFDRVRFDASLAKAIAQIGRKERIADVATKNLQDSHEILQQSEGSLTRILVKEPKKMFFVKIKDVFWFEASGDYITIHLEKRSHLISQSLNHLESCLNTNDFVRVHRSYIVNVHHIAEFEPHITLTNSTRLKLSRTYRDRLGFLFADLFDR
jgi:two-component system, LytTR family, response regulator